MFTKEDFLKVVRSKAKQPLTEQEETFYSSTWEAVESGLNADKVERDKKLGDIETLLGTFDEGQTAAGVIRSLAKKVDDLEEKAKRGLSPDDRFKLRSMLEGKKDEIIRCKNSKDGNWAIEFKAKRAASAMMTTSTILTGAGAINSVSVMDDLEVLVIQYPKNFIIDAIGGRQVAKVPEYLRWKEQNTESTSTLGLTAEGAEKKLTDKSFVWKSATRTKYAGRIEFTEELAMDFDQLLLQVIDMFEQQVIRSWNAAVQTALVDYASDYTSTELDGFFKSPGTSQIIQAGKLWVENQLYTPDICFIRPGDAALATIQQNVNGDIVYIPEAVAFHGLIPFVSTNIPTGKIYIGTSNTVKEQHSAFILRRGVHGDQFIENEETIVGEVFSLLKLPTISQASWLELDIDTITEALTVTVEA
jgi:hypothetical protein